MSFGSGRREPARGRAVEPRRITCAAILAVLAIAMLAPVAAKAELGEPLVQFGALGSGAGQFYEGGIPAAGGLAADPSSGHIFLSELGNNRISEYTAWGEFVKSWGWGVRDGSPEPQICTATTGCLSGQEGSSLDN